MADARARCGDKAAATEIALSALELNAANTDTMSAVANRLLSYGKIDTAVELFTQITDADPDRPQTWRDLALALELQAQQPGLKKRERRALYEQAIGHLNHIIETPWDGAYDGVELISVMEVNRIAARLRKIGGEAKLPDQELDRLLDVDLRVVVTWNIDDVDMDLWVNEANRREIILWLRADPNRWAAVERYDGGLWAGGISTQAGPAGRVFDRDELFQ